MPDATSCEIVHHSALVLLQAASAQLEKAEALAAAGGFEVADRDVAQHRWRLGRALWQLAEAAGGDASEAGRKAASALWLQAAPVEGPHQVCFTLVN